MAVAVTVGASVPDGPLPVADRWLGPSSAGVAQRTASACTHLLVLSGLGAGGAERVAALLTRHWVEQEARVVVVAFAPEGVRPYHDFHPSVVIECLDLPATGSSRLGALLVMGWRVRALRRVMRAHRPDVVVSFLTKINILTLVAGLGLPPPIVVSERNNPRRQRISRAWGVLARCLAHRAAAHVIQTEASREVLPRRARTAAVVIPNPVERPAAAAADTARPRNLVAVGRLVPQKGFDLLLTAFARVAPRHPGWTLTIWGEGPERAALERQAAALGLEARVSLPGVSDEPGGWRADAGAFVLSSRFEGFPNVLAEAMAEGLPIVTTDCCWGPLDLVEDGVSGLLARSEDADALAAALERLLADPDLRQRLAAGARARIAHFAPDRIMTQWDRLLQRVRDTG